MARKKMVVVDPEKIEWATVERALERLGRGREAARAPEAVKRAWVKVLSHDEETGAVALLGKFDKGFHEAKHKHPSDCYVMVLEGKLVDGKVGEIKKGMYWFIPAGVEHGPEDAPEGCVLFVYLNGPAW
jgi:quercetin dioxygenase-like cupin family protein